MTDAELPSSDRRRLNLALEVAGLGEFEWDLATGMSAISPRMSAITGLTAGDFRIQVGERVEPHIHPEDVEAFRAQRASAFRVGDSFDIRARLIRPTDQQVIWMRLAGVVARDHAGAPLRVTGIVEDVGRGRLVEDQRQQLMAELHHRVKAILGDISALARRTRRGAGSLDAFEAAFQAQLSTLGAQNDLLSVARWRGAAIHHLAGAELSNLAPNQIAWEGPEVFLTPRAASALALAFHELAANAVKHGALSHEAGRVSVVWTARADLGFDLIWTETGGPPVSPPTHRGFGVTLLREVTARELDGRVEMEFPPVGLTVRLSGGPQSMNESSTAPKKNRATNSFDLEAVPAPPVRLDGTRILVVEDARLLAQALAEGLSGVGAEIVGPAHDLERALRLLDQPTSAAVINADLGGGSITPLTEDLQRRGIPFLVAVGFGQTGGWDTPVVHKPYDVAQVAAALADLLAAQITPNARS